MSLNRLVRGGLVAASLSLAAACGDSFEPTADNVAGVYTATTFRGEVDGVDRDFLDEGSTFTITLAANGTTTGRLFVPDGNEDGSDLDESLVGTWALDAEASEVTFTQSADTFIRNMTFTASEDELEGNETFTDSTIEVELEK